MIRSAPVAVACMAWLTLAAAATPAPPKPATSAASPSGRMAFLRYTAPVPTVWTAVPPTSRYRLAQFTVPPARGATAGEVVVYYFGPGQGGSAAANIARWTSQFSGADDKPVTPKVETLRVDGMAVTIVELSGRYARGVGMGQDAPAKAGQTLIAAVVETPEGNVTFQLHGDRATVDRHRAGFRATVVGFKD